MLSTAKIVGQMFSPDSRDSKDHQTPFLPRNVLHSGIHPDFLALFAATLCIAPVCRPTVLVHGALPFEATSPNRVRPRMILHGSTQTFPNLMLQAAAYAYTAHGQKSDWR
jgi:hypothetical protein